MSETETIETIYGDVEVEIVDCEGCGRRIKKDQAYEFIVKNPKSEYNEITKNEGYVCEECANDPTTEYPRTESIAEHIHKMVAICTDEYGGMKVGLFIYLYLSTFVWIGVFFAGMVAILL